MRKAVLALVFSFCLMVVALVRCTSTPSNSPGAAVSALPSSAFTLLYGQGREGQLEPCGCHTYPFGGVDRESNAVTALRASRPNLLYIESGDLFAPLKMATKPEFYRDRGALLVKILGELGVQVYGPGPGDYALGLTFLKKVEAEAKFKMVSTNVVDKKGKAPFAAYQLVEVGGIPVAVLSVVAEKSKLADGLKVTSPKAALQKAVAEIGGKAKLVIAMTNLGTLAAGRELANSTPEVNIWVGNDYENTLSDGEVVNNAIFVDGHRFGYYLGKLVVDLKTPIKGFYTEAVLQARRERLAGLEKARQMVTEPKRQAELDKKIADYKKSAILDKVEGQSPFQNELMPLDEKTYGQPNKLTEWVKAEKEKVRQAAINGAAPKSAK